MVHGIPMQLLWTVAVNASEIGVNNGRLIVATTSTWLRVATALPRTGKSGEKTCNTGMSVGPVPVFAIHVIGLADVY